MLNNNGYSLLEVLIVLLLGSLIMLSCSQFFMQLQTQSIGIYQRFRLQQMAAYLLNNLEKDLQRSGFSLNGYFSGAVTIVSDSCLLTGYDYERNGSNTIFAYRWLGKTLQQKSDGDNCEGSGWESLNDASEIVVSDFVVKPLSQRTTALSLELSLATNPDFAYRETRYVTAFNQ